ncbi:MAG: hypothetical protein ACI835_003190 [Planctomycetota bacterium]|jgi:hypothetical protein
MSAPGEDSGWLVAACVSFVSKLAYRIQRLQGM